MKKFALLALAAALAGGASAQGAVVYFSNSNATNAGGTITTVPTTNLALTVDPGSSSTIYVVAKRTGNGTPATGGVNFVNGLGLDIKQVQVGGTSAPLSASSFVVQNPSVPVTDPDTGEVIGTRSRWSSFGNGTLNQAGGVLVSNSYGVAVGTDSTAFNQAITGVFRYHAALTFTVPANAAPGTVYNLFFAPSTTTIAEQDTTSTTSQFGRTADGTADDASVINTAVGQTSPIPDAIITVAGPVPEPASLSLLGLGAAGLLARRRRA